MQQVRANVLSQPKSTKHELGVTMYLDGPPTPQKQKTIGIAGRTTKAYRYDTFESL